MDNRWMDSDPTLPVSTSEKDNLSVKLSGVFIFLLCGTFPPLGENKQTNFIQSWEISHIENKTLIPEDNSSRCVCLLSFLWSGYFTWRSIPPFLWDLRENIAVMSKEVITPLTR